MATQQIAVALPNLPPGPKTSSSDQVRLWINEPTKFWESCAREFGDVFTIQLGTVGTTVVFCHPTAIREIFQLPTDAFCVREYNEHYRLVMGDKSLLLLDRDAHHRVRKLMASHFHRDRLFHYQTTIQAITQRTVDEWPQNLPFSAQRSMHEIALQAILHILFGTSGI